MRISDWSSDVCSSDLQPAGVRASRRPLRGLLSMRFFLCATKDLPHPEERERAAPGRASRRTHRGHPAGKFLWSFPAGAIKDRKSVVKGKSVSVRVDLGGRGMIKKNNGQVCESRVTPLILRT